MRSYMSAGLTRRGEAEDSKQEETSWVYYKTDNDDDHNLDNNANDDGYFPVSRYSSIISKMLPH